MYLDLDNQTLSFVINHVNYGYVYKGHKYNDTEYKIDKTEYKVGVTLSREGIAIEMVTYQQIDQIPNQ